MYKQAGLDISDYKKNIILHVKISIDCSYVPIINLKT